MTIETIVIIVETLIILSGLAYILHDRHKRSWQRNMMNQCDELTGDIKRESLQRLGERMLCDAIDTNEKLCIAVIDLDDFARINETYGFDIGDEVLQIVSNVLKQQRRRGDVVGRWRGQGWLMLLPNSTSKDCELVFERIRLGLYEADFPIPDEWTVTLSMGVTERLTRDSELEDLLKRADTVLFEAKQRGKNRVEIFTPKAA